MASGAADGQLAKEQSTLGCQEGGAGLPTRLPPGVTRIPPKELGDNIADLKLGLSFSRLQSQSVLLNVDQVAGAERELCAREGDLVCPGNTERTRLLNDLAVRAERIIANASLSALSRAAALHVRDDLAQRRLPIVSFTTAMRNGPTAAVVRYVDTRTGKWIVGMAFARDFGAVDEDPLFLDGVLVQEMVHYDDVSFLPGPIRCYESNVEIRGHHAMIAYWKSVRTGPATSHPRIRQALNANLGVSSSRSRWYRYLNQIERTDYRIEDALVSMELRVLPTLSTDAAEDHRFLGEMSKIVSTAVTKAHGLRRNVALLSSDSINGDARVITAVARLAPRVMRHYEQVRDTLPDVSGALRVRTVAPQLQSIRASLAVLGSLMGQLAVNADFGGRAISSGRIPEGTVLLVGILRADTSRPPFHRSPITCSSDTAHRSTAHREPAVSSKQ